MAEFKTRVKESFPEADFILFGSKARGEDTESSDLDVLVLIDGPITVNREKKIFSIGFESGLNFNVVFGLAVEEKTFWGSSIAKAMPFYQNIIKEGLRV